MVVVVVVVVVLRSHVCPFQLAQHPRTSSTPHLTDPIINQTQSLHNCQTHSGQHLRVIVSPDAQLKSVVATLSQEMLDTPMFGSNYIRTNAEYYISFPVFVVSAKVSFRMPSVSAQAVCSFDR